MKQLEWHDWYCMEPYIDQMIEDVKGIDGLIECKICNSVDAGESIVYKGVPLTCEYVKDVVSGKIHCMINVFSGKYGYYTLGVVGNYELSNKPSKQLIEAVEESRRRK